MTSFLILLLIFLDNTECVTLFDRTFDSSPINTDNFWTIISGSIEYEWYECPNGSDDGCMVLDGYGATIYHQLSTVGKFNLYLYYDITASTVNYDCDCTFSYMINGDNTYHTIREWSGGSNWRPDLNNQYYFPPECSNIDNLRIYIDVPDTVGCTGNFCNCCFVDNFRLVAETVSPTKSPTPIPTKSPTNTPTQSPTISPTKAPTQNPTNVPTQNPTMSPTYFPSNTPIQPPTNSPTISPTVSPSNPPTTPPTNAPTQSPTQSPTYSPIMGVYNSQINQQNISQSYFMYIFMSIFCVLVLLIIAIGCYHNKFKSKQKVYRFHYKNILQISYHCLDVISDIFLCFYIHDNFSDNIYLLIFQSLTLIIPSVLSAIYLLYLFVKNDFLQQWFNKFFYCVFLLTLLIGSNVNVFRLFQSNFLNLPVFSLKLEAKQSTLIQIVSITISMIFECSPQLIIQIYVIWNNVAGINQDIVFMSMIFSLISIMASFCLCILKSWVLINNKNNKGFDQLDRYNKL